MHICQLQASGKWQVASNNPIIHVGIYWGGGKGLIDILPTALTAAPSLHFSLASPRSQDDPCWLAGFLILNSRQWSN